MMRRWTLRLAAAALTFAAGTAAATIYLTQRAPAPEVAPVKLSERAPAAAAAESSCFPGRSVPLPEWDGRFRRPPYFPPGVLARNPEHEGFVTEWYEKHLAAMGEPSLSVRDAWVWSEGYRFLWLRSFHNPVVVRVWRTGDGHFISAREYRVRRDEELEAAGGVGPHTLVAEQARRLSAGEWEEFKRLLGRSCYWGLGPEEDFIGADGAQWILEGVRHGRYHAADRWSPREGAYREACLYLLELSGLIDTSGEDVY